MAIVREQDTIAAIATALSPSGIGIVRISGPEAFAVADRVFRGGAKAGDCASHTVHYGYICDPQSGRTIDEVLMLVLKAPRTYTREDTIEIDCHGGVLVTKRVLEAVLAAGARLAEPGEFTRRAYLNGRIDLSQAEAVAGIISAKNELALKNSVRQLRGREREEISLVRNEILREIAQIEATLDDPEHLSFEGFDEIMTRQTAEQLRRIRKMIDTAEDGRRMREGIRTVIVGRPNAGKSSLLNALLGEDRAIVTEIAGTTRDTLTEEVRMRGITLLLVDTAGIRATDDTVERIGVERAKQAAAEADLILWVVDSSAPMDENDLTILASCGDKPMIALLNKSDLATVTDAAMLRGAMEKAGKEADTSLPIAISAKTSEGLEELEERITSMFFAERIAADDECVITSERHKQALLAAEGSLLRVQESMAAGMPEDFYTIDLTAAYETLGTILGEEPDEDVINMIFSEFCLGK
ncbi:MAG: tRNA uridine-5-carboxymethylaminomethyl(34) synthesis GTPase MnmE [Lachnospiraceae bacterium]|nr:tRNA uridine-5-carboxymethylaminomethyl(34) synthesis GTPase MnmE [Lachnospiraceae bacterium]MBR6018634.1 tRNA uridine-5-carboxymethylaminomethyl(34) synthesis GTPase MnmE [Lachnospiraceae bacterium]